MTIRILYSVSATVVGRRAANAPPMPSAATLLSSARAGPASRSPEIPAGRSTASCNRWGRAAAGTSPTATATAPHRRARPAPTTGALPIATALPTRSATRSGVLVSRAAGGTLQRSSSRRPGARLARRAGSTTRTWGQCPQPLAGVAAGLPAPATQTAPSARPPTPTEALGSSARPSSSLAGACRRRGAGRTVTAWQSSSAHSRR